MPAQPPLSGFISRKGAVLRQRFPTAEDKRRAATSRGRKKKSVKITLFDSATLMYSDPPACRAYVFEIFAILTRIVLQLVTFLKRVGALLRARPHIYTIYRFETRF